eukprot:m.39705 g.39705  ORF g.39705 m.39705 type:complete len:70 (+) comp9582_c0_seq1:1430-1639(+)
MLDFVVEKKKVNEMNEYVCVSVICVSVWCRLEAYACLVFVLCCGVVSNKTLLYTELNLMYSTFERKFLL